MKYNIGDRVVPVRKTIWGKKLSQSVLWNQAKKIKQKFLYVTGINVEDFSGMVIPYRAHSFKDSESGDYFKESDLKPYVEK